eukprot:scaffold255049_cov21-Tisochrysis_lutea.AAC.1
MDPPFNPKMSVFAYLRRVSALPNPPVHSCATRMSTAALPSQAVTFKQVRAGLLVNAALLYNQAFRSIMG